MRALLILALLLAGCASPTSEDDITVWHDDANGVTCWYYIGNWKVGTALSCLPDSELSR